MKVEDLRPELGRSANFCDLPMLACFATGGHKGPVWLLIKTGCETGRYVTGIVPEQMLLSEVHFQPETVVYPVPSKLVLLPAEAQDRAYDETPMGVTPEVMNMAERQAADDTAKRLRGRVEALRKAAREAKPVPCPICGQPPKAEGAGLICRGHRPLRPGKGGHTLLALGDTAAEAVKQWNDQYKGDGE